ncbi:MAG: signal peptide peptidase SppA [Muribaculaceae bacterium]|nr:signal peptide peptidase SppA [Muribaculaceae bacterium]
MLKKFFIAVCGTITGLWVSAILLVLVLISVVGSLASDSTAAVNDNSILYLDLDGEIFEHEQDADVMTMLQEGVSQAPTFIDMIASVRRAANDSKIKAIYINSGSPAIGQAQLEELLDCIREFKKSGKPVYAYGDSYTQAAYLLASAADHVYLNPVGMVDIHGVGTTIPFFTGLLEKLGIKIQVIKVGSFKSAVEPYILKQMSDSARLQTRQFVDTIWNYYATSVAQNRKVEESKVNTWADSLIMTWPSARVLDSGAVTALRYRREVEAELRTLCGKSADEDLPLVSPSEYMEFYANEYAGADTDHVAVFFAEGDIVDSGKGGISAARMVPEILSLADNEHVKGMVLRVNSGGGSAFASEQIWEALEYFKSKGKPVYVSMGDYAASGGYYISCGADRIYADRTTLTGSIGVFGLIPDFSGLLTDKLGVTFSHVGSGPNAGFLPVSRAMSENQYDAMQNYVENTYATFVGRVAEGRDMTEDDVRRIAEGRVWVGAKAVELKLVDEIGGLQSAVDAMIKKCGMNQYGYRVYPEMQNTFLHQLIKESGNLEALQQGSLRFDAESLRVLMLLERLKTQNPVQARMAEVEIVY